MPLRGLRDLQFTVNYFNQIKGPLLLGVQLFSTWGMEVFPWRVGWCQTLGSNLIKNKQKVVENSLRIQDSEVMVPA